MASPNTKFPVGTKVIFKSKFDADPQLGQEVRVTLHGNMDTNLGLAHGIKFADGRDIWAYPEELLPAG